MMQLFLAVVDRDEHDDDNFIVTILFYAFFEGDAVDVVHDDVAGVT